MNYRLQAGWTASLSWSNRQKANSIQGIADIIGLFKDHERAGLVIECQDDTDGCLGNAWSVMAEDIAMTFQGPLVMCRDGYARRFKLIVYFIGGQLMEEKQALDWARESLGDDASGYLDSLTMYKG